MERNTYLRRIADFLGTLSQNGGEKLQRLDDDQINDLFESVHNEIGSQLEDCGSGGDDALATELHAALTRCAQESEERTSRR